VTAVNESMNIVQHCSNPRWQYWLVLTTELKGKTGKRCSLGLQNFKHIPRHLEIHEQAQPCACPGKDIIRTSSLLLVDREALLRQAGKAKTVMSHLLEC
jgi:uncharacterized Zn-finger protein